MTTYRKACTLTLLWTLCLSLTAQSIKTIPNYGQLPGPVVRTIMQDEEGYIWYGTTESGLGRDDGYTIELFTGSEDNDFSRDDRFISAMSATRHHEILFGTRTGAWLLDKHTYHIERLDTTATRNHDIKAVAVDSVDDSYWLADGSTVFHLSRDRRVLRTYDITIAGGKPNGLALYCDSKAHLWLMVDWGGLRLYNRDKDEFEECQWDYFFTPIHMTEDHEHGCLWLCTYGGGIVRYTYDESAPSRGTLTTYEATTDNNPLSHRSFAYGVMRKNDKLWVTTSDNLYCYEITDGGNGLRRFDTTDFMPQGRKILNGPTIDQYGNIWVPSFVPKPFIILQEEKKIQRWTCPQMEQQTGYPLIADGIVREGDGFWLIQGHIGLVFYRPADGSIVKSEPSSLYSVYPGRIRKCKQKNCIWLQRDNYLQRAWIEGNTMKVEKVVETDYIIDSFFETNNGSILIGMRVGLACYEPLSQTTRWIATGTGHINDLEESENGTIWLVGNQCGFAQVKPDGTLETIEHQANYDNIVLAPDGTLWLSSPDGTVACYDPAKHELTPNTMASDNHGCVIKHLEIDQDGHVWLLTSLYVKEYDPKHNTFQMFNVGDSNIQADYLQDLTIDGHSVVFCGAGGIYALQATQSATRKHRPQPISISEITIDGERQHPGYGTEQVTVQANATDITIHLTTFNHIHADKITFAYRIVGSRNDRWNLLPTGTNVIHLANLSRGTYTVEVKATDENGQWSEPVSLLTIVRQPAWWETWWAWLLYICAFAALLTFAVRYYLQQQKRKHEELMEQRLTEMKFRFFTNISHELRTPLTLIITPLQSLIDSMDEGAVRRKLSAIQEHARQLLDMINNLLSFRKLEMGEMRLNLGYGELNDYVRQACQSFQPLYDKKGVTLHFTPAATPLNFYFDKNILHHILFNLLSNAHKFTPEGGDVAVEVRRLASGNVNVSVSDTGVGIPKEQQKHIFERFYQTEQGADYGRTGSGIGLNMVSELCAIHGGDVSVESDEGQGSTFTVSIPWRTSKKAVSPPYHAKSQESSAKSQESSVNSQPSTLNTQHSTLHTRRSTLNVLIVEDNDEFRQFVCDELSSHFNVLQATDGQEALNIAESEQVDVVVSDVMMPVMDGLQLTRHLKQNEKTSHLTVILLTARAGQESELEGYQCGADYYITKPFDMNILLQRLQQLQRQQNERRQQLLKQMEHPDIDTLYTSDIEKNFMKRLVELIDRNLDNSEYGQEQLSSDICMSYITAYRKIKSLTGQTPAEFIRNYRLKRAARLLRTTTQPVTDISMAVGFSTASYFTRCFLREYKITPTDYRRQQQNPDSLDNDSEQETT